MQVNMSSFCKLRFVIVSHKFGINCLMWLFYYNDDFYVFVVLYPEDVLINYETLAFI